MDRPQPPSPNPDEPEWIEPLLPNIGASLEITPEIQGQNLDDLTQLFYAETAAPRAERLFSSLSTKTRSRDLGILLRDHRERPIYESHELDNRQGFDDLLTFYCVLEVAIQVGYVPEPSVRSGQSALPLLHQPEVRHYYEDFYPLLLAQLYRARLEEAGGVLAHRGPSQLAAFQRVLELDARFVRQPEVQVFLALADDFVVGGVSRRNLLELVSRPEELAARLARVEAQRDTLDQAVHGLRGFLFLCDGLYRALRSLDGDELFQSSLWHLFGYWFDDRAVQVVPCLWEILERLDAWPDKAPAEAAAEKTSCLRKAVNVLSSNRYQTRLLQEAQRIVPELRREAGAASSTWTGTAVRRALRAVEERAMEQGISLVVDLPETLPPISMTEIQFSLALDNLLRNTLEFIGRDGMVIVSAEETSGARPNIRLMVTCSVGPKIDLARVFEPSDATGQPGAGTGLGLAIARDLVEAARGEVSVEAVGEDGMRIRIELPTTVE